MKKIAILILVLCMIFCASCIRKEEIQGNVSESTSDVVSEVISEDATETTPEESGLITLYYSDKQAMYLEKEERGATIEESTDPEFVLRELMKGPDSQELVNVLPEGIKINSCKVENDVCIIDLSKEFIEVQGSSAQQMVLYSVVNTLCAIDGVEKVRISIDGETNPKDCVFDFSQDIEADMSLLK